MTGPAIPNRMLLLAGLASLTMLTIGFVLRPTAVLHGWMIALVFLSGIPLGSLALLCVHRLTGGRWGDAFAPILTAAASTTPLLILMFVPVALGLSALYSWAAEPSILRSSVEQLYLNRPAFILRSIVALVGWSVLAYCVVRKRGGMILAAAGLVFHGAAMSFIAVDWILSMDSAFSSSAFAAAIVVQQLLSALAFASIAGASDDTGAREDLGALMMATLLGTAYLDFMSYVVIWYGNLPEKAAWYLTRGQGAWQWLLLAHVLIGFLIPFCVLLSRRCRQSSSALRLVGGLVLAGVFLHVAWLMAPAFGPEAIVVSVVAVVAVTSLAAGAVEWASVRYGAAYAE